MCNCLCVYVCVRAPARTHAPFTLNKTLNHALTFTYVCMRVYAPNATANHAYAFTCVYVCVHSMKLLNMRICVI